MAALLLVIQFVYYSYKVLKANDWKKRSTKSSLIFLLWNQVVHYLFAFKLWLQQLMCYSLLPIGPIPIFFAGEEDEFEDTVQPSDDGEFCCRLLKHLFLTRTGFYLKQQSNRWKAKRKTFA